MTENTEENTEEPRMIEPEAETKVPFVARIHGTGKVTLPKNVRDLFDLKEGDYVSCIAVGKLKPRSPSLPSETSPEPSTRRDAQDEP